MGWRMKPFPVETVMIQSNVLRNISKSIILSTSLQGNAGVPGKNGEGGEMVLEDMFIITVILGAFWPKNDIR